MMMAAPLPVLLLLLLAETLAKEDMREKVFLFPKEFNSRAHVILQPEVKKPLEQVSVCLRSYTDLTGRTQALFSLNLPVFGNIFLVHMFRQNCEVVINRQSVTIRVDPEKLSWKHTCVTWDSSTGVIRLWVDGKFYVRKVLQKGYTIQADATFILGQDQVPTYDTISYNNAFSGEISDVQMWDYVLTTKDIIDVMYGNLQGNLISWRSLTYEIKEEVLVEPML